MENGIFNCDYESISQVCMDETNVRDIYDFSEWVEESGNNDVYDFGYESKRRIERNDIEEILASEYSVENIYTKDAKNAYIVEVSIDCWREYVGYYMYDEVEDYTPPEWIVIALKIQNEWKLIIIENTEGYERIEL